MFMFQRLLEGRPEGLCVRLCVLAFALGLPFSLGLPASGAEAEEAHAIAMHGKPAMPAGFTHIPYVNPDAPKGGRLTWGVLGTFDSLNPFIVKGLAVQPVRNYVVESLLARGNDEPFTLYGLLARSVETDDERSFVTFHIDPRARFSDGKPVRAEDVLFSWQLLRDHGRPNHRQYYGKVARTEAPDPLTVRFDLAGANDRELPLILGLMPILPKHAVDVAAFEETTLSGPVGSGPYRVTAVRPGASVTLTRNPDYWGRDLAINRGLYNFEEIRLDYFREANGQFEAFKRGLYDFRIEHEPLRWHDGYDFPAAKNGDVIRDTFKPGVPQPSEFLVFNTRRPIFADIRVRQALTLLFDFELVNRNYFFNLYSRVAGYFAGSDLSAYGKPADARERELLKPFAAQIPPDIMDGSYRLPVTDGSGRDRTTLRAALKLLSEAGYDLDGTVLRNRATKAPFTFEILVTTRDQERVALAFQRDLRRAGIEPSVRSVDPVQFDQRRLAYEFDMIQNRWDQSLSPGNEQYFYWGSAAADSPGTRNYMGARDPAVDAMIAALLEAREHTDFVSAVRALDRALISGFYTIPLFNLSEQWIARWNRIERPEATSLSGYLPETWWSKGQPQAHQAK
ncbi:MULTISPECIES: extracellular solute-binding protein [unclassified Bradyrhizobium]|uniref:extracellular solute-binding protein n=1 Tax=unclassified Bradyrhizobium TaxID=2631580 RepID=UPI001FFBC5EB|nr:MULTISPECIES: extracellular solute-binding protein [unclassified Bradyrhizobium]MCK1304674.1 ABC transporter substrate-binding protein [Bradyrhizobium sp. 45]MCK1437121.1 ABC transporter substrate-binding protein [Bradyrhizobium sp. 15]MCK1608197.1 ABC transporter substrate-binding protein [Bradyrhizobium sp. 163]MCK1762738.1 ABC transporter substrate-binding protein [Bradyrhizobium sp. 136]